MSIHSVQLSVLLRKVVTVRDRLSGTHTGEPVLTVAAEQMSLVNQWNRLTLYTLVLLRRIVCQVPLTPSRLGISDQIENAGLDDVIATTDCDTYEQQAYQHRQLPLVRRTCHGGSHNTIRMTLFLVVLVVVTNQIPKLPCHRSLPGHWQIGWSTAVPESKDRRVTYSNSIDAHTLAMPNVKL